jgi:hypothetical protein
MASYSWHDVPKPHAHLASGLPLISISQYCCRYTENCNRTAEVRGSIPLSSTKKSAQTDVIS